MLNRRNFIRSLTASVVAASMPLPIGFPKNYTILGVDPALPSGDYTGVITNVGIDGKHINLIWKITDKDRDAHIFMDFIKAA